MSLVPMMSDFVDIDFAHRLFDQSFGGMPPSASRGCYRPWRPVPAYTNDIGSTIKINKDKFQIDLDVQHFLPEEVSVKTADGFIVIKGQHEERKDPHGFVSRQFSRRYVLPEDCDPDTVASMLSSDGVLTVLAPKKLLDGSKGERVVPIAYTGPVKKEVKDETSESSDANDADQ